MSINFAMIMVPLLYIAILAAVVILFVRLIKYLIRYGIDYYFQKLEQYRTQHPQLLIPAPTGLQIQGGNTHESDHYPVHHRERAPATSSTSSPTLLPRPR